MKKKILLTILLVIFSVSSFTLFLILNYMNPYSSYTIAMISILTTFLLSVTSFLTISIYFLKKVYYRGEVFMGHIFSSFRQAFLLTVYIISIIIFNRIGVMGWTTAGLAFFILIFIELLVQNIMYRDQ
ncbi:MAG: hypothetical protein PHR68_05055 [Candidatus Gracilibacteria bacterium]|nr:hypothetical protein [Candidatus Gracilibacteria bacterium]